MRAPLLLTMLLLAYSTHAAEPLGPRESCETFLTSIAKGDIPTAYDKLFEGSPLPAEKPQAVTLAKSQTAVALPLYGKILGFELVKEERYGSSIARFVYVLKSEKLPIEWEFYFYRPKDSWFLVNVSFNDQLTHLR